MGSGPVPGAVALRDVIATPGALHTLFQPIVRVGPVGSALRALECLTRGPARTPYAEAVPLFRAARAERLEPELDRACVAVALETAAYWGITADLFLNVNPRTLEHDAAFPDYLAATAVRCGVARSRLTIEVTEHGRERRTGKLVPARRAFAERGMGVAFDDVGASVLDHRDLRVCRPDFVKLDGRLFRAARLSWVAEREVGWIVAHARHLGVDVIAEGVEQCADAHMASQLGIELAQGHLFCRPLCPKLAARADILVSDYAA